MPQITRYELARFIVNNLHQLTDTRPLIVPFSTITITRADFERVADGNTLADILSCPADIDWVALKLAHLKYPTTKTPFR